MSRYGYRAQLDPRVSVYNDEVMDFSMGSMGQRPRDVAARELSEGEREGSYPVHTDRATREFEAPTTTYAEEKYDPYDEPGPASDSAPAPMTAYIPWTGGVV